MSNDSATARLIINLSNSYKAITEDGGTLHEAQLDLLKKRVREIVARAKDFGDKLEKNAADQGDFTGFERRHDVITVHGKRGTGKTTFLIAALTGLQKNLTVSGQQDDDTLKDLCVLDIIDPTLFGKDEHLLHLLLGTIAQKVRTHTCTRGIALCDGRDSACRLEQWEKSLQNLAEGLKFIGEIREDLDSSQSSASVHWEDAAFLMERNLDSGRSGLELERHFHKFLHASLKLLGKKAFVLAIDDADTRPTICWHVLEVLRRYFTSPQLVVILFGDMTLFHTIIEKKQLSVFGLNFTSPQIVLDRFQSRVDDLTEQYLLKILRTPTRISLGSFQAALNNWERRHEGGVVFVGKNSKDTVKLDVALDYLFHAIGCHSASEQWLLRDTLLNNPTRTVVQILDCLEETMLPVQLAERLREAFLLPLQQLGFEEPADLAEALQTPKGVTTLMKQLFARDAVEVGLELLPTRSEQDVNNALLALQATLSAAMHANPSVLFAYMFKACLLREILTLRGMEPDKVPYPQIERYLALEAQELPSMTAARLSALHCGDPATGPLRNRGMIRLYSGSITKNAPIAMEAMYGTRTPSTAGGIPAALEEFCEAAKDSGVSQQRRLKAWINTPETLCDMLTCWQRDLVNLGVVDVHKGDDGFRFFSVFPLLATMGDILVGNWGSVRAVLNNYAQSPSVNMFNGQSGFADNFVEEQEADFPDTQTLYAESEAGRVELLQEALGKWAEYAAQNTWLLPSTLSARIMTRFFKALTRIDEKMSNNETFVGLYIHRCLIAFFNSVLIEEYILQDKSNAIRISIDVPATSDTVFLKNIRDTRAMKFQNANDTVRKTAFAILLSHPFQVNIDGISFTVDAFNSQFPLFSTVFSFPLWGLYLEPSKMKGDGTVGSVYEIYMYMQTIFLKKETMNPLEPLYTNVSYGKSQHQLKNLYPVLNSLARTAGTSAQAVDKDWLNEFYSEIQSRNRKRAKLLLTPKKFPSTAVLSDIKTYSPELLQERDWGSSPQMPPEFHAFYRRIVEMYFPRVEYYDYLFTPEQAADFWKVFSKD